jgi:hypothetical protein
MQQLVLALMLVTAPLAGCVASTRDPGAAGAADWVEVDNTDAKASADKFKAWYKEQFGEERYRAEFGE